MVTSKIVGERAGWVIPAEVKVTHTPALKDLLKYMLTF